MPLLFVLSATALKELFEDVRRHGQDRYYNKSECLVLDPTVAPPEATSNAMLTSETTHSFVSTTESKFFRKKFWQDLRVGEIVKIRNEEVFPADLLLLSSSEPDGFAYVETSNLDGETNLKIRQSPAETSVITTDQDLQRLEGYIIAEKPNNQIYHFEGTLELYRDQKAVPVPNYALAVTKIPLGEERILLRGCTLRNTKWIYGIVLYTGHDTKLMQNASAAPIKRTFVERMTNIQILFLFVALLALSLASTLGSMYYLKNYGEVYGYLDMASSYNLVGFIYQFLTFIILYNNLIPISLVVTMELVKFQQAALINQDLDMYFSEKDRPALARTSNLVEELGMVKYVFSDKTGTLTCNKMELKEVIIGGTLYVEDYGRTNSRTSSPGSTPASSSSITPLLKGFEAGLTSKKTSKNLTFTVLRDHIVHSYEAAGNSNTQSDFNYSADYVIRHFMILLSAAHTVIPEINNDGVLVYQAASPDEGALVKKAAELGYKFTIRRPRSVTIEYPFLTNGATKDHSEPFDILNVIEFNSERKRMSVIIRDSYGVIRLYMKGADNVILDRLAPIEKAQNPYLKKTMEILENCATQGFRTLCFSMREVPNEEYAAWLTLYQDAATSLTDRSAKIDAVAEIIEKDLMFLGSTAVEDKLQDRVPETIATLGEAGIKVWVLTGDKVETAINIGYSCKLILEDDPILIIQDQTVEATKNSLTKLLESYEDLENSILVVDGKSLSHLLTPTMDQRFFHLASKCRGVLCCRSSPIQKAQVVKLVKKYTDSVTLAIGDGANDVSMIQAADVGVGISGEEGLQAARSADFSIAQFCYLSKLLMVHGAWSYHRLSKLILYSFYKNIALYMTQFWYSWYNLASGQTLYESWMITLYNVIFTFIPPIMIGVTDQHLSARELDRYPRVYKLGQTSEFFNVKNFWGWTFNAIYHSLILFFSLYALVCMTGGDLLLSDGTVAGHWYLGTMLYIAVLLTVLGKAALILNTWTWFAFLSIPGSILSWFVFFPLYDNILPHYFNVAEEIHGLTVPLYSSPVFWLFIMIVPALCLYRDIIWKYARRQYLPKSYHIIQEFKRFHRPISRPPKEKMRKVKEQLMKKLIKQGVIERKSRGFAFSQADKQAEIVQLYDTSKPR